MVAEVGRTPGRGDRDALGDQVAPEPRGEGEYGDLVAGALDEHDGALHPGDDNGLRDVGGVF